MVVLSESYIPKSYQAEEDCNLETQSQKTDKQTTLNKQCGMFNLLQQNYRGSWTVYYIKWWRTDEWGTGRKSLLPDCCKRNWNWSLLVSLFFTRNWLQRIFNWSLKLCKQMCLGFWWFWASNRSNVSNPISTKWPAKNHLITKSLQTNVSWSTDPVSFKQIQFVQCHFHQMRSKELYSDH